MEDSDSYRDQQFVKRHNFAPSLALKLAPQTDLLLLQYTRRPRQAPDGLRHPGLERLPGECGWLGTYYGSSNAAQDDTTTSAMQSFTATLNPPFQRRLVRAQRDPRLRLRT